MFRTFPSLSPGGTSPADDQQTDSEMCSKNSEEHFCRMPVDIFMASTKTVRLQLLLAVGHVSQQHSDVMFCLLVLQVTAVMKHLGTVVQYWG